MQIVNVPASICPNYKDTDLKPISFKDWLINHIDSYASIKTPSQVRQANKIVAAIEAGDDTMSFEDAEFEVVKGSLQDGKYIPAIARQLIPFYDAIDGAQEVKK
jgi:hypothetical protein